MREYVGVRFNVGVVSTTILVLYAFYTESLQEPSLIKYSYAFWTEIYIH